MSKPSDLFIPSVAVRFCEILPLQMLAWSGTGERNAKDLSFGFHATFEDNIRRKYVYVFSSSGSVDYGIDRSTPGWATRSQSNWSCQHMAPLAMDAVNPKASKAPNPDQVDMEVYVDQQGRMWPLTITKNWETPRHERPHPLWGKHAPTSAEDEEARAADLAKKGIVGFDWLQLPLSDASGAPKRYYFLLSPFQLGPAGLKAALKDIGTDGLSLWFDPAIAAKEGRILGPDPETLKQCGQTVVPIVDPYNFASEIHHRIFERALDAYLSFVGDARKGKIPGLDAKHFDEAANGGTIDDLYFMAGVLANLRASKVIDDEIDAGMVDEILGGYGWQLQRNAASCEVAARFLGNWMTGPAHAILDRAALEDLDKPEDAFGADDRAAVLLYWWHKMRLLPNTMTGAVAVRQILSETEKTYDNPLRFLFRKFEKPGKKLDLESNEGKAAVQLSDIIPDIVFLSLLRFDPGEFKSATELDPDKAEERGQRTANLVNNLGFLDTEVVNSKEYKKRSAAKDAKEAISTRGKNILKGGLYLMDGAGKMTVTFMKGKLLRTNIGFQAAEVAKIKDYKGVETLGKQLKEMTQKSEEEMAQLTDAVRKAESNASSLAKSIEATRSAELQAPYFVRQVKVAEARRAVLQKQISQVQGQVRLDESYVNSTRGAKGAAAKTQQARVAHVSAQTRLRQSLEQLDRLSAELRTAEEQIASGSAELKRLAPARAASIEAMTKELESAIAKGGAASKQAVAESDKLAVLTRQGELLDELADAKDFAKATKEDIPRGMLYISIMSFGIEMVFAGATLTAHGSSKSDIGWATGDLAKAMADLGKDALKVSGVASVEWAKATGANTFLKVRGTLTLSNASGLMAILGVIGGAYNVVKYGAKGIDAFKMDDYSVMVGASLAVVGGVLGIVSAMGATALGLTASGVGVLGGILVAAGALIISFTADNEWEYFAEHCYFSKDAGNRNTRSAGKGDDHWLGKMMQPSGGFLSDGRWSVRAQRDALVRLLSRYSICTLGGLECHQHYKLPANASETSQHVHVIDVSFSATCVVDFQSLPFGASLNVKVEAKHVWSDKHGNLNFRDASVVTLVERSFSAKEMDSGTETVFRDDNGQRVKAALLGKFAGNERPGFICIMLERRDFVATKRLEVCLKTELNLPDGSKVLGDHLIAKVFVDTPGYHEDDITMGPTFVEKFEGAVDRGF